MKVDVEGGGVGRLGPANVLAFEPERLFFEIWNGSLDALADIFPPTAQCKLAEHEQERRWCGRDFAYFALAHCRVELWDLTIK